MAQVSQGFEAISSLAVGKSGRFQQLSLDNIPRILDIEILTPTERRLHYRYEILFLAPSEDELDSDDSTDRNIELSWNDECQYIDGVQKSLWKTSYGETTISENNVTIFGNTNLLYRAKYSDAIRKKFNGCFDEMLWVYRVLSRVRLLGKTFVRPTLRSLSVLKIPQKEITPFPENGINNLLQFAIQSDTGFDKSSVRSRH